MNNVEVNLNGKNNNSNSPANINYKELNKLVSSNDKDNSGEGINNSNEELEEEPEQEELTSAEINRLKKIQEQTLLRAEKYAHLYINSPPENNNNIIVEIPKELNSDEKITNYNSSEDSTISNNMLEPGIENDNEHFNKEKINPNKERLFQNIHCYFYLGSEPLIIIGPNLSYFIWIFTFVSFFSIFIYSLKNSSFLGNIIYISSYIFFASCYILLMAGNPGIPTEKKHYDINDLNANYSQCNKCNCIFKKKVAGKVYHCEECGICIEECDHHSNWATKCIGKKNKKIYKAWIVSILIFVIAIIFYLIL